MTYLLIFSQACHDGKQNQGETAIDCGGPCAACSTCDDKIQNQGETDVDCGGPCDTCSKKNSFKNRNISKYLF